MPINLKPEGFVPSVDALSVPLRAAAKAFSQLAKNSSKAAAVTTPFVRTVWDVSGTWIRSRQFVIGLSVVILLTASFAFYFAQRPLYNWDMVAYVAVAQIDSGVPLSRVHASTYDALAAVPANVRRDLVAANPYREHVASDPARFLAQLPFYTVKPLYPILMSMMHRAGVGLVDASVFVSVAAYAALVVLLFLWFSNWAPVLVTSPLAVLLALSPFLTRVGQLSTPDMLSAFLILLGTYLGFEKKRYRLAAALLIVSITARPENIIYSCFFLCYIGFMRQAALREVIGWICLAVVTCLSLSWMSGNYGWKVLFYFTFIDQDIDLSNVPSPSLRDYIEVYKRGIDGLFFGKDHSFSIFAMLGLGAVAIKRPRDWRSDGYIHLVVFAALCALFRVIILPADYYRALLAPELMLLVAFVEACCESYARQVAVPASETHA